MISRNEDIRCAWCLKTAKLGIWNDNTFSKCLNREMKRAFTQLTSEKAFLRKSDTFYLCPNCERWSRGSQLKIVNTTDERLLSLGGEPVIQCTETSDKL